MTTKNQMLKNVRLFCSECMGAGRATELKTPISNPGDVEGCTAPKCIWFPFRMGLDPKPARRDGPLSEKQKLARESFGKKARERMQKKKADKDTGKSA